MQQLPLCLRQMNRSETTKRKWSRSTFNAKLWCGFGGEIATFSFDSGRTESRPVPNQVWHKEKVSYSKPSRRVVVVVVEDEDGQNDVR